MKIQTPGHRYIAQNFASPEHGQTIQFIEKAPEAPGSTNLGTVNDGTTNEELLKILINRLEYLQAKFPCRENAVTLTHLETALLWLGKRTADRIARAVEGTNAK